MSDQINGPVLAASLDELRYLVFRGMTGATGQSAYELAVSLGFEGTEAEWIASLHGTDGRDGSNGHSLRVNSSGHVEYYDDATGQWIDTGIEVEGVPGPQGEPGTDGVSPSVVVGGISGGHRVTITDKYGQHTFDVLDGSNGSDGADGTDGQDGADGYAPEVTVTQITGGHRVTITDKTHQGAQAHTFDVLDGEDGAGVPDVSGTDVGKVMTVGVGGAWVAAEPIKQVKRVNYYAAASGTHAQGDLTVVSGDAEIPTSGLALANAIADGFYPIVFEVGTSYPRVYHPEMILAGTMITFRSTDVNGNVAVLNVEWNASTATPFSAIGDMPTPDVQTDVGKVPTVNSSGGYSLQTPSGGGSLPSGGTAGQVLKKTSDGAAWADEKTELPSGGTAGQILKKTASGVEWANESGGGSAPYRIRIYINTTTYEYFVSEEHSAQTIVNNAYNCEAIFGNDLYKLARANKISSSEVVLYFVAESDGGADGFIIHAVSGSDGFVTVTEVDNSSGTEIPDLGVEYESLEWQAGKRYNMQTGEIESRSDSYCIGKFNLQDGKYSIRSTYGRMIYADLLEWDEDGNFVKCVETNANVTRILFCANPKHFYAINTNDTHNNPGNMSLTKMEDGHNEPLSLDLASLTFVEDSSGNVYVDVTAQVEADFSGVSAQSFNGHIDRCPDGVQLFVNGAQTTLYHESGTPTFQLSYFGGSSCLLKVEGFSSAADANAYFDENPLTLTINGEDQTYYLRQKIGYTKDLAEENAERLDDIQVNTPRVAMASTDTTATIDPNKLYVFPEMASLAITLAAITDNTIVNEYHFIFESGSTATTLTLPGTVIQPDGFTVEANMIYEVSILENCMTAQGWAVTSA